MNLSWSERNAIVANLFNPAFCGEIIRIVINNYNKYANNTFPFAYVFLILPILLHKKTRERLPRTVRTYLFVWIEQNDDLFFDFDKRTKNMVKFTKEALIFLLAYNKIEFTKHGELIANNKKIKQIDDEDFQEYNLILKKAEMFGKWLSITSDVKSVYSFFRIIP